MSFVENQIDNCLLKKSAVLDIDSMLEFDALRHSRRIFRQDKPTKGSEPCRARLLSRKPKPSIHLLRLDLITSDQRRSGMGSDSVSMTYRKRCCTIQRGLVSDRITVACAVRRKAYVGKYNDYMSHIPLGTSDSCRLPKHIASGALRVVDAQWSSKGPHETSKRGALTTVSSRVVCLVKRDEQEVMA